MYRKSCHHNDFYPRSPCGERHKCIKITARSVRISIHALLAESDPIWAATVRWTLISIHALLAESDFGLSYFYIIKITISIHALLAESDIRTTILEEVILYFYPRSPCGERLTTADKEARKRLISIHALLAESDEVSGDTWQRGSNFYPRSPCGERQLIDKRCQFNGEFLSTLSLRRAT